MSTDFFSIQKIEELKQMKRTSLYVSSPLLLGTLILFYKQFHLTLAIIIGSLLVVNILAFLAMKKVQKDFSFYPKLDRFFTISYALILLYAIYNTNGLNSFFLAYVIFGLLSVSFFYTKNNALLFIVIMTAGLAAIGILQINGKLPQFNPRFIIFYVHDTKSLIIFWAVWLYLVWVIWAFGAYFRKYRAAQIHYLEGFLAMISDAYTITYPDSYNILYVHINNPDRYGIEEKNLIDKSLKNLISKEEFEKIIQRREKAYKEQRFEPMLLKIPFPKGIFVFQIFTGSYYKNYNVTILLDVTEDYKNRRRLAMQRRIIYSAYFVEILIHELNNITTVFGMEIPRISYASIRNRLSMAYARQKQLLDNLSTLTRDKEALRENSVLESIEIQSLCKEAVQYAQMFSQHNINIILLKEKEPLTALVDREYMLLALNNIITNSLRALESSKVHEPQILLKCQKTPEQDKIVITISDNGPGIPQNKLSGLFDLAKPRYGSRLKKDAGMGLGLLITKAIIENFNGEFLIESKLKSGTTATIKLPLFLDGVVRRS